MGFNCIYWTSIGGSYFLLGSNLEKILNILGKVPFFRVDMAGLGSIGLNTPS